MVQYRSQRDMLSINADYKVEKGQYYRKAKHSECLLSLAGGELLMHIHCRTLSIRPLLCAYEFPILSPIEYQKGKFV